MKFIAIFCIRTYQWCIAPLIGNVCRFYPSCSHYALEAIEEYGFMRGSWLTLCRLSKCHPWHPGGHDEVPRKQ